MTRKRIFNILVFLLIYYPASSQNIYEWYQDGIVVFQFKSGSAPEMPMLGKKDVDFSKVWFLSQLTGEYNITRVFFLHPDIRDIKLRNTLQIEFDEAAKVENLIARLKEHVFIEYAEKKELHKHFLTPNDPYYNTNYQWSLFKINAGQAWDISTGSTSVVVAVTDNAIWTSHPDLTNKLVSGYDVADNDNNVNPAGGNDGAHGTHVSGTVGAQTNNTTGVASIGYNIKVMPVKIGRDSDGSLIAGYDGITWAADNGAEVINMSWGGGGSSTYGQNVCNYAWNSGSILVAAAGNDNVSTVFYPAGYNNVVSVASTDQQDKKSSFSQYGTWIKISAPGTQIPSTVPTSYASSGYAYMSGTSMASPHVAGLLGLMKSANPSLSNSALINCLYSSSTNIDAQNPGYINQLGHGRINAYAALQCVTASAVQRDAGIEQILQPTGASCNTTINPVVKLKNFGSDPLTSVTINYQIVGQTVQTQSWSGNLVQGATTNITLPAMTSPLGQQVFRAYTSNPNGQTDQNLFNDEKTMNYGVFTAGIPIPFTEDFESGSFATNMWTVQNPDGGITWEIAATQGTTPGDKSARMEFFNYNTVGQRDALITPPLNFSGYSSVDLYFEHAYRRQNQTNSDSLVVFVSTNCGASYQRILTLAENGTGVFATATISTSNFVPAANTEWCVNNTTPCYTVNLDAYAGLSNVIIKFEGVNSHHNNLYIDNINIDGSVVDYDIGVTAILHPSGTFCGGAVTPRIVLHNFGGTTITSAQINYQLNGGTVQPYSWSGSLSTGNADTLYLPQITPVAGQNTLYVYSSLPNGNVDSNPFNDGTTTDFFVVSNGTPLPFSENFESNSFATNGWTIEDPDNVTTWAIYDVAGTTPGTKSSGVNFFFYSQTGQRDGMITKYLDFTNYTNIVLTFEHAYRRYNTASTDSLIIYVSGNCGASWTRVFARGENGQGVFATAYTSTTNFIPQQASDWCHTLGNPPVGSSCFSINLTAWAGQPLVQVKFESYNNYGNNLFVDNINITGDYVVGSDEPMHEQTRVELFPNPVNHGFVNIFTSDDFTAGLRLEIYNILGVRVLNDLLQHGNGQYTVDVRDLAAGTYLVSVRSGNFSQTLKLLITE